MQLINKRAHLLHLIRERRLTVLGVLVALFLVGAIATFYFVNATAMAPSAADVRLRGWVSQLSAEQLTPARHQAQQQLEAAGPAAVDPLVAALHASNSTLRRNSAEMLGYIASPRALDALNTALTNDPVPSVRARAAWSLGELNDVRIVTPLERTAVMDSNPQVRQEAEYSLNALRARLAVAAGKNDTQVSAFALAPSAQNIVYLAEMNQLAISRDSGKTWNVTGGKTPSLIMSLAVSSKNPNVIYAGTESLGVYKSTDAGTTWVAMNQGIGLQPGVRLNITALAIDPQNPDHIYAALGTWLGTTQVTLYPVGMASSVDGGATWQKVNAPATETPITRLVINGTKVYASAQNQIVSLGM